MAFSFAEELFNMRLIFFFLFDKNVDIYYRKVLALTLFLSTTTLRTYLVILVFFVSLALVDEKLLLPIKYVSRGDVSRLIFFKVLILLFCWNHNLSDTWHQSFGYLKVVVAMLLLLHQWLSQLSHLRSLVLGLGHSTRPK